MESDVTFAPIPEILDQLKAGRMIVLVDDEQRENEGDLVCAAESITPQTVNFMVTEGRGLLCVALDGSICEALELPPQSGSNTSQMSTAYTVTVDAAAKHGVTTGISAGDRATTIRLLADPQATVTDFARPGHINPLRARDGGVLVRTGQTEGSVDLCKLAGLRPAAAIIEVMNPDGSMARLPELEDICDKHDLKMCSVSQVIAHRIAQEKMIERVDEVPFDTQFGQFNLIAYRSKVDPLPHVALTCGRVGQSDVIDDPVLVRIHSQNLLGDVFGDASQPSGETLHRSMQMIQQAGEGAIVYMRQDGMGTGLLQRLQTLHDEASENPT
jgi:3,4-dihydroxy 2-butanone 4-phosphate synthase/GTP cyclohydrolase II